MRLRIALIVAALLAPMTLLALYLANERASQEQRHLEAHALAAARTAAAQYGGLLALARAQVKGLVPFVDLKTARGDCDRILKQALPVTATFHSFYVVDHDGGSICTAQGGLSEAVDGWYSDGVPQRPDDNGAGLVRSSLSGAWMMVLRQPLADGNDAAPGRTIFAALDLAWLQAELEHVALPSGGVLSLVDFAGHVVTRAPYDGSRIGREISDIAQVTQLMQTRGEAIVESVTSTGVPRVVAYMRVPGEDLFVRAVMTKSAVAAARAEALYAGLAAAAAGCLLALALGLATLRRFITDPLDALAAATARLGAGQLSARTDVPHDHAVVGRLAAKLDELAQHGERVTRALRTLSGGNRTLLRERDEGELLRAMCRVAVERGGYVAAYVCYPVLDDARSIRVMACEGADDGFIGTVNLTWADVPNGQGTVGRCIRSGERVIIRSIAADPLAAPWREAARARGFGSVISLPLRVQGQLAGTFTLVAREEDAFDAGEVELLDELAADLAFGIEIIRGEGRRREAEEIARRALTHDGIVGLPNRQSFVRTLDECVARAARRNEPVAVLDLHVGRLQAIIDNFGHHHGMELLKEIARRLRTIPGLEDRLARLPTDDFGIALPACGPQRAEQTARTVLEIFRTPITIAGALVDAQGAIGVAFYPGHGTDGEDLVRRASIAARDAFRREQAYCVYGHSMREDPGRLSLAAELRATIDSRLLLLHYQPKLRLADGALCGCEALVRWPHPRRGMVPPNEFVALAQDIGLMGALTYHVLDLALRQQHEWLAAGVAAPIAVNLSARNLYDPALPEVLEGLFTAWGVAPGMVEFEITEDALVDDPEAARKVIAGLRERGAKIYIDDFGTGYSSLSYLVSLPVHALKIDRSFIRQMGTSSQAHAVVASIISMAHSLNLRVVAEGVETAEDAARLRELGCDEAQGYLYARPTPAAEYAGWCAARRA